MTLLLRPAMNIGEGPKGYLFRLAQNNGLEFAALENLSIHFDVNLLSGLGYLPVGFRDTFLGQYAIALEKELVLNRQAWNREVPRYCPVCLQHRKYWRFEWEIMFFDACPEHQVWLMDRCDECNQRLTWKRHELLRCNCGASLVSQRAASCPSAMVRLCSALSNLIIEVEGEPPLSICAAMSLMQLQRFIRFLGTYGDPMVGLTPKKPKDCDCLSTSWQLTSLAAEILEQWPKSFYALLDRMLNSRAATGAGRLSGRFGNFYALLYRAFPEAEFDFMRSEFESYVAENWQGSFGRRNRRLFERLHTKMSWIPALHARNSLGVSNRRLKELMHEGRIRGEERQAESGRKFFVVSRLDIDEEAKKLGSELDMAAAAALLNLKKMRFASILPMLIPEARRTGGTGCPWAIPRKTIDELLNINQTIPEAKDVGSDEVSLGYLLRYWSWGDNTIAQFLRETLDGAMTPLARIENQRGITGWIFSKSRIQQWYQTTHQKPTNTLSVREVATRLSIKQEVAYFLVRSKMIKAVMTSKERIKEWRVHPDELEGFAENYVFGRDLAENLNTTSTALVKDLSTLGISPICGPKVDECRQIIFIRSIELADAMEAIRNHRNIGYKSSRAHPSSANNQ